MSLALLNKPSRLSGRRNWVENFFAETDDFFKNMDWDTSNDVPGVNVREEDKQFIIEVAAPGMKKEDFKVELDNGMLKISAKTELSSEKKEDNYVRREFSYRNFQRSFWMPDFVNGENIRATYEDGLLKVALPKMEKLTGSTSKKIQVS